MSTFNPYPGRLEGITLGIEATAGTSVAPQVSVRWMDQDLGNATDIAENESAMGVPFRVNSSDVVAKYASGKISGKVTDVAIGYLLLGFYGSVDTGDVDTGIYPHTFTPSTTRTTLTVGQIQPGRKWRFAGAVLDTLEFTAEAGGYCMVSADVQTRPGASSTDTLSYVDELEFTSKQITVKTAANLAGLSAATALSAKSVKLTLTNKHSKFDPLGTNDVPEYDGTIYEAQGEFVVRYSDTSIEDDMLANTVKALELNLANGTTSLDFQASKTRFRTIDRSVDKDDIVTQTVQFYCEFDSDEATDLTTVLNNATAAYAAA